MIPARRSGGRRPVWSAIAPPWEKPASRTRAAGNPRAFSRAISASTRACDARIPAASSLPSPTTSYQARITYPRLIVTGRIGAWGKTNRRASVSGSSSSATIGSKSWPSAPSPCIQMTDATGCLPVSSSIASSRSEVLRASAPSTELCQDERVVEAELAERVVAARGAAVTGLDVDLEEQRAIVELERPELRDPLGGLPIHHLAVVQRGAHEDRRVAPGGEVRVRAVGLHIRVVLGELRVAPLLELAHRQRERRIEHRVDHVHERHPEDGGRAEVGPHVQHGADQEAARAPALDHEPVVRGRALAHQELGARDEIGERVALLEEPPVVVPPLPELPAPAHMGDRDGHAALEKAQTVRREGHGVRQDRKSTRLNSSHGYISYAVFCLKKKKIRTTVTRTDATAV